MAQISTTNMESEISTLFTTLITKVNTGIESLLLDQERTAEVITKLIKENGEKDREINKLKDKYESPIKTEYKPYKPSDLVFNDHNTKVPSDNPAKKI